MMPEWHQLDSSCTMSEQQESVKKKNFKIKFQVILVFYQTSKVNSKIISVAAYWRASIFLVNHYRHKLFHNAVAVYSIFISRRSGINHAIAGHYRPASETPFVWRFAGGQIMAQSCMLAGIMVFTS